MVPAAWKFLGGDVVVSRPRSRVERAGGVGVVAVLAAAFVFNLGQGVLRLGKWVASVPTGYLLDTVGWRVTTSAFGAFSSSFGVEPHGLAGG